MEATGVSPKTLFLCFLHFEDRFANSKVHCDCKLTYKILLKHSVVHNIQ